MPELEHALRGLGAAIEFPEEPDLSAGVRRRLREAPGRGWAPPRLVAVGLAVVAVAVGAVLAVPPARTAVFDLLGIGGVSVSRVETLPKAQVRRDLGDRITLAEARRIAPWLVEPRASNPGPPDAVYVNRDVPGGEISFLWGTEDETELLMTQATAEAFAEKMLGSGTNAESTVVEGKPAIWFYGEPHVFVYRDTSGLIREETSRLARNTLLWQEGALTVRIEGGLSKTEALDIARSVR